MKVGILARLFRSLDLLETTDLFYQGPQHPTFYEGRYQIDATWVSPSLRTSASIMAPFYFGAGDHRVLVVDFPMEYVMCSRFIPMCRLLMIRLISCQPKSMSNYLAHSEFLFKHHRTKEKLHRLEDIWESHSQLEREERLNKLDNECNHLLLCLEKKSRKLRTVAVEHSPILLKLGLRWRFWRKVAHFKQDRFSDFDYILKKANYLQISEHRELPFSQCIEFLKRTKEEYLVKKASQQSLRDEFVSKSEDKSTAEKRNREKLKLHWRVLKKCFGKPRSKNISAVDYSDNG